MRERPILFGAPMVRALLEGRKAQTRRIVKPGKDRQLGCAMAPNELAGEVNAGAYDNCPYGQPGDRLWVREATYKIEHLGWIGPLFVESEAGHQARVWGYGESDDPDRIEPYDLRMRPSIHMPRAACRLVLEIIAVRAEKLQNISEEDAHQEGVDNKLCAEAVGRSPLAMGMATQCGFAYLWDMINGTGSWAANPWVWVVEIRRVQP